MGWYRIEGMIGCPVAVEADTQTEALHRAKLALRRDVIVRECASHEEAVAVGVGEWLLVLRKEGA